MITGVNHIGIAVRNLDHVSALMQQLFGARELERRSFPQAGQTSSLVAVRDTRFELMEPLEDEGVVARYLARHGEGLHHVSLWSNNLDQDCEEFEKRGVRIVARTEDGDIRVAFSHPSSTFGVVFEIAAEREGHERPGRRALR